MNRTRSRDKRPREKRAFIDMQTLSPTDRGFMHDKDPERQSQYTSRLAVGIWLKITLREMETPGQRREEKIKSLRKEGMLG